MQKKNFTAAQALMLMRETREVSCLFTFLYIFHTNLKKTYNFSFRLNQMWDFCNSWAIWITNLELKDTENYLFEFYNIPNLQNIALIMNLIIQFIEISFCALLKSFCSNIYVLL